MPAAPPDSDRAFISEALVARGVEVILLSVMLGSGMAFCETAEPWREMDYGPFLTATIEAPQPEKNLAYKGLAIRLDTAFAGDANEAIVFDTDLLRYGAGWTGNFVALKGVVFDGEHWAYPRIDGDQIFGNLSLPGWAHAGSFTDPREHPYGPVPDDWGHWEGLSLHGQRVVLHYTVGAMKVLEMPGLERHRHLTAFARTINLGTSSDDQVLQVAFEQGRTLELRSLHHPEEPAAAALANGTLAILPPARGAETEPAEAAEGLVGHWTFDSQDSVATDSGAGTDRVMTGSGSWTAQGHDGGALSFDGRSLAAVPNPGLFNFWGQDLSFTAWIRTGNDGTILAKTTPKGDWVPDGKALFVRDGRLTFDVGWVGAVTGRSSIADDRWHHVALTWTKANGEVRLYVDGQPDGQGNLRPRGPVSGHVVRLGFAASDFPASPWFRGIMDDLRVYDRPLDAVEVARLGGVAGQDSRLLIAAVVGAPEGARWLTNPVGHLRLFLPKSTTARRLKLLLWRGPDRDLNGFAGLVRAASRAQDLRSLTQGGPARWPEILVTQGTLGEDRGPYAVDTLTAPEENPWKSWLRFGGLDFFADGKRAAICTWNGDVWVVDGIEGDLRRLTWQRIATGLFQPLGLKIVNDQVYVLGRDQITRLHDLNGDGEIDFYENFNNDCMTSEHFHEFATDLKTDPDGNFYYIKCACHAVPATHPHHGTLLKLPPDGSRLEVVARGFRAVNGLGVGPAGELVCVDNQGYWMPGNRINWVAPGGWYGNQLAWNPDNRQTYDEPLCWMHNFVDRSGGTFVWVPDDRWGPLTGQIISISYGMGYLTMVLKEEVDGVIQGGVTRFPMEFDTGVMRGVFHRGNGQLYTCGLYGWAGNKTKPGGFYRVRYTGKTMALPTRLRIARDGMLVSFAAPLDPASAMDLGNYNIQAWNYRWTADYGSPDLRLNGTEGRDRWPVQSVALSADHQTVFLQVPEIQTVMQMHLEFNLRMADGTPARNFIHNTIHTVASQPGLDLLGAGVLSSSTEARTRLTSEAPGLLQTIAVAEDGLRDSSGRTPGVPSSRTDRRVSRLAAMFVPRGESPSPFLPRGPFRSAWRGHLKAELNDDVRFHLTGRGHAILRLNDREILSVGPGTVKDQTSPSVPVRRGLNPIELIYESPADADAEIRLLWESPRIPLEPVPATALVHDAAPPEARRAVAVRAGRDLFARHLCVRCHQPDQAWPAAAMAELQADAPSLDGIGSRFNEAWIVDYLVEPGRDRPDGRMPQVLRGDPDVVLRDARDIASFLTTQTQGSTDLAPLAGDGEAGGALFEDLGCIGCHRLADGAQLTDDPRIPLNHVPAKWRHDALRAFLQQPDRHYVWTRMPTFALTDDEAASLANQLGQQRVETKLAGLDSANPERGRELVQSAGCLACHALSGLASSAPSSITLAGLQTSDWGKGCLAARQEGQSRAPDFGLTETERQSLQAFALTDWLASLNRSVPAEFAARQYVGLRCNACHGRDGEADVWSQASRPPVADPNVALPRVGTGSVHVGRPQLSFAGEKLHAEWMGRFLTGELPYKPRQALQGVMPAFRAQGRLLSSGLAHEHGYSAAPPVRPGADPALARIGERLTRVGDGFGCVACHDVGRRQALAGTDTATINFAFVADRLLPDYYARYLRDPQRLVPGTMMPAFIGADGRTPITSEYDGDPQRQFAAIWQYLLSLTPDTASWPTPVEPAIPAPAEVSDPGYE